MKPTTDACASPLARSVSPASRVTEDYAELVRRVRAAGLLEPRPGFHFANMAAVSGLLVGAIAWLVLVDSFWLRLPSAVFLALVLAQVALIGHDGGHRQIFRDAFKLRLMGFVSTFLVGGSFTWWKEAHDLHHAHPHQPGRDPATDFSLLAVTPEQAASAGPLARLFIRYQAFLLIPLMALYGLSLRVDSVRFLASRGLRPRGEVVAIVLHHVVFGLGLLLLMGPWGALVYLAVNQVAFALCVTSIFVPNHHGMPVMLAGREPDFVRHQVLTARNVRNARIFDPLWGGLNFQIEHHLFPAASRNRLRDIAVIVRAFCREKGIAYHETTFVGAFREALSELHRVGQHARLRAA